MAESKINTETGGSGFGETKYVNETMTIPAITIKTTQVKESENYQDKNKILSLQIFDILSSNLISEKPCLYSLSNNNYRYVEIVGTIIQIKLTKKDKITLLVDDGSGTISCIYGVQEEVRMRKDLDDILGCCSQRETMEKEELHKFAEMSDTDFFQKIGNRRGSYMNTVTKIFSEKLKNTLMEFPLISELNTG